MGISKADKSDIPALVALLDSAYRGDFSKNGWTSEAELFIGSKRTDEPTITELMNRPTAAFLKYVDENGEIKACVLLNKKNNRLYLGMLSVSPSMQGTGIGKKILKAAESYATENDCNSIFMTVISIRTELINWYEKLGYKISGDPIPFPLDERFGIPKQPLEMVVMEKRLNLVE